ncbi:unnamed protein product [Phytophthora fragariaefolia]|uniref:Unnamed protein product n=1 Tax=Phytophthora fragariaefolia TaxID=1490495 RepID=A0A9W6U9F7_9STRA|nr:unnamed protein product [Phytophthora fragariaefolia]
MAFGFGLLPDAAGNTGVVVFVDRLSKMAHLAAVPDTIDGEGTATLSGRPSSRCLARLGMSTADPPQTDGQTERVNRVVEDVLRSICAETPKRWSAMLPLVEFGLNNAVHASTGFTPFYVNGLSHPRVPLTPPRPGSGLSGGEVFAERLADISPLAVRKQVDTFLSTRRSVLRQVRDAMAETQDKQKEHADAKGRSNVNCYEVGDLVLLNAKNLPAHAVYAVFKTKLRPRFIGPLKVVAKKGLAYTLNLPKKVRTHPVFYVGLLKPYLDPARLVAGGPTGQSPDSGRAEPLAGEPADQSDRGAQPAFAASPHCDGQSPANTAPSAQELPPGHQDHGCDPKVREELGPSPTAGAAIQYHRSSDIRAGQRLGRATTVDPGSARASPPRPTSGEDSVAARQPPPALLDKQGNRQFHVERILAKRRCRGHNQYLVKWRGYPHSENAWEFEVPLRQDCHGVVDAFDQIDQRSPEGSRPRRRPSRASRL